MNAAGIDGGRPSETSWRRRHGADGGGATTVDTVGGAEVAAAAVVGGDRRWRRAVVGGGAGNESVHGPTASTRSCARAGGQRDRAGEGRRFVDDDGRTGTRDGADHDRPGAAVLDRRRTGVGGGVGDDIGASPVAGVPAASGTALDDRMRARASTRRQP